MNYIKNNKVFLFLFLCFSIMILSLSYRIINGNQNDGGKDEINTIKYAHNSISYFNGSFSDQRLGIEFSWNVQVATGDSVVKYEIFKEDKLLKSGKNAASAVLTMKENNFLTGNNEFHLIVTFSSGEELRKTVYVYIDEAFDFSTSQKVENNKIVYNISYYYDDRCVVNPPQMNVSNAAQALGIKFVSAEEVRKEGNYVYMKVIYELSYAGIEPGKYAINIDWVFSNYNLTFNSLSSFEVEKE